MRGVSLSYETVESGAVKFGQLTPMAYALANDGISTRCSYRLTDVSITFGEPWIKMATNWTSWSRADV